MSLGSEDIHEETNGAKLLWLIPHSDRGYTEFDTGG
jgi:hypothetical protein